MFGPAGHAYVYFNYGVHWMLNVSAGPEGRASGVLIRAAVPVSGLDEMRLHRGSVRDSQLLAGPGRLTQAFGIDRRYEGVDLLDSRSELHIVTGEPPRAIWADRRIGLAAGKGEELPWRYLDAEARGWWSRPTSAHAFECDPKTIES
jgi:DNA-3-methyladenine glycosylase